MDRERGHLPRDIQRTISSLHWVKLVGVGNLSVGKTCLIKHFCESKFGSGYQPTVGVDYGFKIQNVQGCDLRVHLWDLSGGPEFLDVRNELYGDSDAIFVVFDVTNRGSFDAVDGWLREIAKYGPSKTFVYLVGNKTDVKSKRLVSASEAKKWATSQQMTYFETSCANGEGVESMFDSILKAIAKQRGIVA